MRAPPPASPCDYARTIARLLRDKRVLSGEAADSLIGAISQAIDEIGTELGIAL